MFSCGILNLERLGFKVKLGALTSKRAQQGYRSGSPNDRAREFMELVCDPEVHGLISTAAIESLSKLTSEYAKRSLTVAADIRAVPSLKELEAFQQDSHRWETQIDKIFHSWETCFI